LDRNDRPVIALIAGTAAQGLRISIPTTALAQAMRSPERQTRLSRLSQPNTDLIALDGPARRPLASCCGEPGRPMSSMPMWSSARRAGQSVVTSDPGDLRRIAPELSLFIL